MNVNSRGATLVELLMAVIVLAIAVSMTAGLMLSGGGQAERPKRKEEVSLYIGALMDELKNYVAAPAAGSVEPGPDEEAAPGGNWRIPGDACNCWALKEGAHDVTASERFLPKEFRKTHNARLTYNVTLNPDQTRRVDVTLDWEDPK